MTIYLKEVDSKPEPTSNADVEGLIRDGYKPYDECDYAQYLIGTKTFVNGEFINEPTEEYKATQLINKRNNLQNQIDELDIKRIRAIAEPSQKDTITTWLDYYTAQIKDLRQQIKEIN